MTENEESTRSDSLVPGHPIFGDDRARRDAPHGASGGEGREDGAAIWRLPSVGGLTLFRARYSRHRFTRHSHPSYVIAATAEGKGRIWLRGAVRELEPGSLIFIEPGEVHTGESADEAPWSYRAIYPHPRLFQETLSFLGKPSMIQVYFPRCVVRDEELAAEFLDVHRRLERPDASPDRATLVSNLLLRLVATHGGVQILVQPRAEARPDLQRVRRHLEASFSQTVTLEELSDLSGLSRFHLVRSFRRVFGLPPRAYQIQVRIDESMKLLLSGQPVEHVARAVGFRSGSYFARAFRERVGLAPGQYVAGMQGSR